MGDVPSKSSSKAVHGLAHAHPPLLCLHAVLVENATKHANAHVAGLATVPLTDHQQLGLLAKDKGRLDRRRRAQIAGPQRVPPARFNLCPSLPRQLAFTQQV